MIRVLIADDHAVVRRGVAQILDEAPDMVVAGEANTGREALRKIRENTYDVLVLDIAMPDGMGMDVLAQLNGIANAPAVLILSIYPEKQYAIRALKAGASGYLTKDSAPYELIEAVRQVAAGGRFVSRSLAEALAAELAGNERSEPHQVLSDREFQVLKMLATGMTISAIGEELALSVKTISTYRSRILDKLGMHSTAQIIRYAVEHHLVE